MYDKVKRKHKEWLLVSRLSKVFEDDIVNKYPNISSDELMRKKKEKIMELYLNYIYLGNQTYGIQAASRAYFARNSRDLSIVQSAILASMPQAPTTYNPYKYPIRVIGKLHISDAQGTPYSSGAIYTQIVSYIQSAINSSTTPIPK
jgi:hypothetical protein